MANELDAYKTEQTKLLEAQKARAQESAYINHQKLLKYLEQSSASKGYSVGMTESAKIAAANQYSQDVAAADAAYNQGMGKLNNYLRTEQERLDDKAKAEQKVKQDEIYGEVMTKIESGEFNTTTELSNYLNDKTIDTDGDGVPESSFLDLMSPTQRATVQGKLSYYQKKPEQIAADEEYYKQFPSAAPASDPAASVTTGGATSKEVTIKGLLVDSAVGNNFKIETSDGTEYKVELGEKVNSFPEGVADNIAPNTVFVYGDQLYYKRVVETAMGETKTFYYKVRGRGDSVTTNYTDALNFYKS